MVPVLYAQSGDAQAAVNQTTDSLIATVKAFNETAQRLQTTGKQRQLEDAVGLRNFIKGCQFYCSGNLTWR